MEEGEEVSNVAIKAWPSETGLQGLVSNHPTLLGHNGLGSERLGKRCGMTASGMIERDERK